MSVAGRLTLTVDWDGRRIVAARVDSTRPQAARLLAGRTPAEAAALVPLIFSLCGQAQGVAARIACAAAAGDLPPPAILAADAAAVRREAVGEHLWRLLLDWPEALGVGRRDALFADWRRRLSAGDGTLGELLEAELLGATPAEWLAFDLVDGDDWRRRSPSLGAALLRALGEGAGGDDSGGGRPELLPAQKAADWAAERLDAGFAAVPSWRGWPAETGALARQARNPAVAALLDRGERVAARLTARLVELARLAGEGEADADWVDAAVLDAGVGIARVETARGTLVHRVRLGGGRVGDYVIVAPTEWNFRPGGAFCREIEGLEAADAETARRDAARLALALDPCVDYEVKVSHA